MRDRMETACVMGGEEQRGGERTGAECPKPGARWRKDEWTEQRARAENVGAKSGRANGPAYCGQTGRRREYVGIRDLEETMDVDEHSWIP